MSSSVRILVGWLDRCQREHSSRVSGAPGWRLTTAELLGVSVVLLGVFLLVACTRLIDGDEGYLLYAARLLSEGQSLYSDFFFPQGPAVPSVYAWWYQLFGPGWYSARVLAALIATGTGTLVFALARAYSGSAKVATLAVFLYTACGFTLGWVPIVKTYGLTLLCGLAGVYALERGWKRSALVGGFLIVLALEARLYVGIIGLNAIVFVLRGGRKGAGRAEAPARRGEIAELAAGAALGLLLLVPPFLRDFETAYFGLIEFATVRFPQQTTLFGPLSQKLDILQVQLSLLGSYGAGSTQLLALVLLGTTAWFVRGLPRNRLTASIWPTLLVANLLPAYTFSQYACLVVPFVAIEAALMLSKLAPTAAGWRLLVTASLLYAVMGVIDAHRYCNTGLGVIGVSLNPPAWKLAHVLRVSRVIDSYQVNEAISWWPGYFVTSKTHAIPELANHFGFHVTERYGAPRRRRLVLISEGELAARIAGRRDPLVVSGLLGEEGWLALLGKTHRLDRTLGLVSFWVPRPQQPATP